MQQKKVLIAGVAGFLGSHLADALIASGLKVVGVDDWISGNKKNIEHLFKNSQFDFIEANINQKIPEALQREDWLAIVHVANTEIPHVGSRLELNELLTNSFGVKNLLDLALRTKSRFVLTSTIDVYQGLASQTSLRRYYEDNEHAGVLGYSEAKRYAEALCQEYATIYGLDVRVARLSETYGPRMNLHSESLTAELVKAGLEGKSLALEEVGSRMMYVTYYSDVIFGLNKLIVRDDEVLKDGIFYLVNDEPVSILSLVLTIKEYAPKTTAVEFLPKVEESLFDLPRIDLSRSRNELYWASKVSLQEGIKNTFSFFGAAPKGEQDEPNTVSAKDVTLPVEDVVEDASAYGFAPEDDKDVASKEVAAEKLLVTGSQSNEVVEKEIIADMVEETQENMEKPQLESPKTSAVLEQPAGWMHLKNKTKKFDLKGVSTKVSPKGRLQKVILAVLSLVIIWFILMPFLGVVGHGVAAWYQANKAQDALAAADWQEADTRLANVAENLGDTQFYWQQSRWFWSLIRQADTHASFLTLIQSSEAMAHAGSWGVTFVEDTKPWWGPVIQGEDTSEYSSSRTTERLAKSKLSWRVFRQNITLATSLSQNVRQKQFPSILVERIKDYTQMVKNIESLSAIDDDSWENIPQWFGYEGAQEIVVLLQNNHEIRPGGGFIGSYALVTLDEGVIRSLLIDDIYNPDGQLEGLDGSASPVPEPLAEYLDLGLLFARDSNWWPHFPKTGAEFSKLYTLATDVRPDWIIGLNLGVLEDLLNVVGEIDLPDQGTTITADTLFQEAEVAAEVSFEPGSTGKRDFLTEVAQQLWLNLFPIESSQLAGVFSALGENVLKGEVLLYSTNPAWQNSISTSSLTGQVSASDTDYLYVVSSNVGANKANYWVERAQNYAVFVDRQGQIRSKLTITYTHTGQNESWPNGLYKDYLRVYVPQGAGLIDSVGIKEAQATYDEFGHTVFAGLIEVPVNSSKQIEFSYTLPETFVLSPEKPYELEIHSQPGIENEPFDLQLGLPLFLKAASSTLGTVRTDDHLSWSTHLTSTHTFVATVSEQ